MGSHSVTCYPTEVRIPPLPTAEASTRLCFIREQPGVLNAGLPNVVNARNAEQAYG